MLFFNIFISIFFMNLFFGYVWHFFFCKISAYEILDFRIIAPFSYIFKRLNLFFLSTSSKRIIMVNTPYVLCLVMVSFTFNTFTLLISSSFFLSIYIKYLASCIIKYIFMMFFFWYQHLNKINIGTKINKGPIRTKYVFLIIIRIN